MPQDAQANELTFANICALIIDNFVSLRLYPSSLRDELMIDEWMDGWLEDEQISEEVNE